MARRNKQDPTGQGRRRRKASRTLTASLKRAQTRVLEAFNKIPRQRTAEQKIRNAESVTYEYALSPREQEMLNEEVERIIEDELDEVDWEAEIEPPYRQGVMEETQRTNHLIEAAIVAGILIDPFGRPEETPRFGDIDSSLLLRSLTPEQAVLTREYRRALEAKVRIDLKTIKTLSTSSAADANRVINQGMSAGKTPSQIAKDIQERFNVSEAKARRIAETEINKAYNDGKIQGVDMMAKRTGLRAGVIHISALLPTTRAHHAARHGNAYTTADQQQWWDTGANRINCKCSVISVLIDAKGNVVQSETQKEIKAERKFFE